MDIDILKFQIAKELTKYDLNNINDYLNSLYKVLPKFLNKIPRFFNKDFYEFAGKFMKYLWENQDEFDKDLIADIGWSSKIFMLHYNEYYNIDGNIQGFTEIKDITKDVIIILQSYCDDTSGIIEDLSEAKNILVDIFVNSEFSKEDLFDECIIDWDKVFENITYNDYIPLNNTNSDIKLDEFKSDNNGHYYPIVYDWNKVTDSELKFYFEKWQENKLEISDAISKLESKGYLSSDIVNNSLPQPKLTKNMQYTGVTPDEWLMDKIEKKGIFEYLENNCNIETKILTNLFYKNDGILKYFYDLIRKNNNYYKYISIDYDEMKGTFFENQKPNYIGSLSGNLVGTRIIAITINELKIYTTHFERENTNGFW